MQSPLPVQPKPTHSLPYIPGEFSQPTQLFRAYRRAQDATVLTQTGAVQHAPTS